MVELRLLSVLISYDKDSKNYDRLYQFRKLFYDFFLIFYDYFYLC